ncbi:hypothetical protein F8388_015237 [Cannabis sativa]|uniref:BTB/POZ domain-containing protein n=1 Tax=Cannabis sativa TaxID=3483 RepID=A0A7J6HJQ4_CANSA|nr:hypothetical protein F8388_015237 [Cannabis sativa]KAF4395483.1 hypothetical protein G4B88_010947 [Cannabis sativa]
MACMMKLGSKSEVFRLHGETWFCSTGLPSDVTVEVGQISFHLHKFPLLSKSGMLENLIGEFSRREENHCILQLNDLPGGAKAFLLIAKFCYGVKVELNASNIVIVRCAAEYLQMTEDYGEGNLISQTENFLNEIFGHWTDSLKVLLSCEEVFSQAEELHIVSRCINSLATKACAVNPSLFSWPVSSGGGLSSVQSPESGIFWNGISSNKTKQNPSGEDWWYEDVSFLRLHLYKRFILAIESRGMKPEKISGSLIHYTKKHLCLLGRESSLRNGNNNVASVSTISSPPDSDQRNLLEEIVGLLPYQKGVTPTNFLLRLLRTSMILNANASCRENLEKRIGVQLDQVVLEDLLIPSMGYSMETLYDIDCVQRILDHFMVIEHETSESSSNSVVVDEEGQMVGANNGGSHSLTPITMVANLIDGFLAEVAPDANLKLMKFQSLAAVIPEYARPLDDGIYHLHMHLRLAHPWLTDSEREQICRLMNCQKLSLEASTHVAQNERLPLRVIVQVLFFEQLRLRTSVAGWFFVSDSLDNVQNQSGNLALARTGASNRGATGIGASTSAQGQVGVVDDMRDRVSELEKECLGMKEELEKLVKNKGSWNMIFRKLGFRSK